MLGKKITHDNNDKENSLSVTILFNFLKRKIPSVDFEFRTLEKIKTVF